MPIKEFHLDKILGGLEMSQEQVGKNNKKRNKSKI